MLYEFKRIVLESNSSWALLENVKGVPDLEIEGYSHQRIDINQGWYDNYSRLRHIQFYSKDGLTLDIPKLPMRENVKPLAIASDDRSFSELCHIQGLSNGFDLPEFNIKGKKKLVGNGVPLSMANVIARSVLSVTDQAIDTVTKPGAKVVTINKCPCGCKRELFGRKKAFDSACRKRIQRKRDSAAHH